METAPLPTPDDVHLAASEDRRRRRNKLLLIGCGFGCLLPMVVLTTLGIVGYKHFSSPGDQMDPARVLQSDTDGFVRIAPGAADREVVELLIEINARLAAMDTSTLDPEEDAEKIAAIENARQFDFAELEGVFEVLPESVTGSLTFDDAGQARYAFALRLGMGGRFVRWFVEFITSENARNYEHEGRTIHRFSQYDAEASEAFAFYGDSPVIASDGELLEHLFDQLDAGVAPSGPTYDELMTAYNTTLGAHLVETQMGFRQPLQPDAMRGWFRSFAPHDGVAAWPDVVVDRLRFTLDLDGRDMVVRFDLFGILPEDMPAAEAFVDGWLDDVKSTLAVEGITVSGERLSGPGSLVIDVRAPDIRDWWVDKILEAYEND